MASEGLRSYLLGFSKCFRAWRHDTSHYAEQMIKGYLLLEGDRTYANIDRKMNGMSHKNGQNLQQFMSDSPWESAPVFSKVQGDVCLLEGMAGGSLNFDEFGDECAGTKKAGAARQYIGRLGKTELGQVAVVGSYCQNGCWVLVDAELFLPEGWFGKEKKKEWARLHIPRDTEFKTKIDLAKEQFRRALQRGLLFGVVGCDSLYGSDPSFRRTVAGAGKHYMACVKSDTALWLENPAQHTGAGMTTAKNLAQSAVFESLVTRNGERGPLRHEYAFVPVWSKESADKSPQCPLGHRFHSEMLVIRKEHDGKVSYALSNMPCEDKQGMAEARAERYFVERTIQDCKSELGLDELQALKYRALMHTLALCSVASLYIADMKIAFRKQQQDVQAVQQVLPDLQKLPDLSLANVKELLRAAFPLPDVSKETAVQLVVNHLFNRSRATQSKTRKAKILT